MPTLYDNFSQIRQYIDENAGQADLSAYVTKTELAGMSYVTTTALEGMSYATTSQIPVVDENILPKEDGTYQIGSESYMYGALYANKVYLGDGTSDAAHLFPTYAYVADYVAEHGGGGSTVIDENIIPKETGTYTLGDSSHLYAATYSSQLNVGNNSKVYNDSGGITFSVNGNNGLRIGSNSLYPKTNKGYNIGSSSNIISTIYTSVLYTNTAYLQDTSYSSSIVPKETGTYTLGDDANRFESTYSYKYYTRYNCDIHSNSNYNIYFDINGTERFLMNGLQFNYLDNNNRNDSSLGTSSQPWGTTYTSNLYADNIHNFIWTGTAVEYEALADYTTYQLYLVKDE